MLAVGMTMGGISGSQGTDPPLIFGTDAGIVLTFVHPDKVEEFDWVIGYLRDTLEQSDNPIRRQQAEHWQLFRSSDPGPNGAALYVSFMEPVLKGADYSIANILEQELPAERAQELVDSLTAALSQRQSILSLDTIIDMQAPVPDEPSVPVP
jgi:hypothetical protein